MNKEKKHIYKLKDVLLVTCPGTGGLVYLKGLHQSIISIRPSTGMSIMDNKLIWAYQTDSSVRLVTKKGSKEIELSTNRLDLHDVLFVNNNLYVVATENNEVLSYDKYFKISERWKLPGEHDSAHINSIAVYNGRLIASIFGGFKSHRGYKKGTEKLGQVIDVLTGEILINELSQPHSLTIIDDLLYLCNSEQMELHVYRGTTLENKINLPGYTRGIGVGEDNLYIGISLSRNIDTNNKTNYAGIAILNRNSMEIVGIISIPFREVYDIVVIDNKIDDIIKEERNAQLIESANQQINFESQIRNSMYEIDRLKNEIDGLKNEIDGLKNTRSWRITRPLRDITNFMRSIKYK